MTGPVDDPSDISVFLGHDWDRGVCENTRDEIGRVIIHPDYYYEGAGFRNDAALIEILEPAPAAPVRILTPEEEAWYAPSGSPASAVGWGRTDDRSYPRILRHVDIPVWTPEDCLRDSLWRNEELVHERTLCAGKKVWELTWEIAEVLSWWLFLMGIGDRWESLPNGEALEGVTRQSTPVLLPSMIGSTSTLPAASGSPA